MRELFLAIDSFTIPGGATSGTRIVFDGPSGTILFFDENDLLVARLSPEGWEIGDLTSPGIRVTIGPSGDIRIRDANDVLVTTIDQQGYTLRDASSGLVVAEIRPGHLRLVDPVGTDDIELTTATAGTMPNPVYRSLPENAPGATVVVPAAPVFTTTPAEDLSIGHVAAWLRNTVQSSTWTPPGGWTERLDDDTMPDDSSLAVSLATLAATAGAAGTFTNTLSNWQLGIGSHVVIRGGGSTPPSFQSEAHTTDVFFATGTHSFSLAPPSGTLTGRVLIAFVALGNDGGGVPTDWQAPEGWVFLGATFNFTGSGSTLSTLAVGVWAKLGTASEPATYDVSLVVTNGRKTLHACVVAVQDPFLVEGGAHIRIAGHPIRRLLAFTELQAASATLCDFQDIPPGYDHLEVIYTTKSDRGTDNVRNINMRFNGDNGANYHTQRMRDGVSFSALNTTRILLGAVDGTNANFESGGRFNILDYAHIGERRVVIGDSVLIEGGGITEDTVRGIYRNTTDPISRVTCEVETGPTLAQAGSRVYLYGY